MNEYQENDLVERLAAAEINVIHPLQMTAEDQDGETHEALAINEVSLFRQRYQPRSCGYPSMEKSAWTS